MTDTTHDDLVKRLRNSCSCNIDSSPCMAEEECRDAFNAADRIEDLIAENERLGQQCEGLMQAGMNNGQALILAEAKLAMAVEALQYIYDGHSAAGRNPQLMANKAEDALAAIKETPHD